MIYKALIHADPGPTTLKTFLAKDYFNIEDRWIKRLNETMKKPSRTGEMWDGRCCWDRCLTHPNWIQTEAMKVMI